MAKPAKLTINLTSLFSYYFIWLAGINLATQKDSWLVPMLAVIFLQCYCFYKAGYSRKLFLLLLVIAASGWLVDSLIVESGLVQFNGLAPLALAPYWLACIWVSFVLVFNQFFHDYFRKTVLWCCLGAFFFPLTYYIGCVIGAGLWVNPLWTTIAYTLFGIGIFIWLRFITQWANV
tara:strand:- start:13610 stop:14137 length:528 start_codon:yes stop_codon:yes gene_type:complete